MRQGSYYVDLAGLELKVCIMISGLRHYLEREKEVGGGEEGESVCVCVREQPLGYLSSPCKNNCTHK